MTGFRVPDRVRRLVVLGRLDGRSCEDVAAEFGVSAMSVSRFAHDSEVMSQLYRCSSARLDLADREVIYAGFGSEPLGAFDRS